MGSAREEGRPKVLLVGKIEYAFEEWGRIKEACEVVIFPEGGRTEFIRLARKGRFDGCVAIVRSNQYTFLTGRLDAELLDILPGSVKYICNIGAGVDAIDLEACRSRHIQVSNTPALAADGVAETVFFLIFGVLRRISIPLTTARHGKWQKDCPTGSNMSGRTIGLIGNGETAAAVAERARAFGMQVQYCSHHNKVPTNSLASPKYQHVTLDQLIRTSDIISLHIPLTSETKNLLSAKEFEAMKDNVVIINTARGGVIDDPALLQAVRNGKVWGAGLDVFDEEPHIPEAMREDERFFVLPHIATKTLEIRGGMEMVAIENLGSAVKGRGLLNPV